jgi:hypothetical protein
MHEASCQAGEEDKDPAEEDRRAESGKEDGDGDGDARQHPPQGKQQTSQQPQQQSQQQPQPLQLPDQDGQEGGEDEPEREDEHDDDCFACGEDDGKLLMCDTCEKVYHTVAPLIFLPSVHWISVKRYTTCGALCRR